MRVIDHGSMMAANDFKERTWGNLTACASHWVKVWLTIPGYEREILGMVEVQMNCEM